MQKERTSQPGGLDRLIDLLTPPGGGEGAREQARLLLLFSSLVVFIVVTVAVVQALLAPIALLVWTFVAVSLVIAAVPLVFRWTGSLRGATNYFMGASLVAISWVALWTGGLHSPNMFWLNTLPLTAAILAGRSSALIFGSFTLLFMAVYGWLEVAALTPASLLGAPGTKIHAIEAVFGVLAYAIAVSLTYVRRSQADLQALAENAEQNQQLVRVVCHDLGTPLLVAHGHAEAIETTTPESAGGKELRTHTTRVGQLLDELRAANLEADAILRGGAPPSEESQELGEQRIPSLLSSLAPRGASPAELRRALALVLVLGLVVLMAFAFALLDIIFGGTWVLRTLWCFFGVSFLVPLVVYRWTRNLRLAGIFFVSIGTTVLATMSFLTGGLGSPILHYSAACPLVVAMLIGGRPVIVFSVICSLLVASYALLDWGGWTPRSQLPQDLYGIYWVQSLIGVGSIMVLVTLVFLSQLQLNRRSLERSRHSTQRLVRSVCVDLLETLRQLRASIALLEKEGAPERSLAALERSSSTMQSIVADVRELNQQLLEGGPVEVEAVDLGACVAELESSVASRLAERGQTLEVRSSIDKSCRVSFVGAKSLTHQVLGNLVGNATKFSPDGAVIKIGMDRVDQEVIVTVADQGTGIEEQRLGSLFRPDLGGSTPGLRGEKGTGFGLPIAKSYVDMSGGDLSVETVHQSVDPERSGTTFTIRLIEADGSE